MKLLLTLLLAFQAGSMSDVNDLRQMLGKNYRTVLDVLNTRNQAILRNTERLAPQQAAQMRARMIEPPLPADQLKLSLDLNNVGQGLVLYVFEHDFTTDRINLFFCAAQPAEGDLAARTERLVAIQVLLDDSVAPSPAVEMFQSVYGLPRPFPLNTYESFATYPIVAALGGVAWDLGAHEAIYQSVRGNSLVNGQFWITDKGLFRTCSKPPKLVP